MIRNPQGSRVALAQAASAVALSALSFLILLVLQQRFGEGLRYQERFFGHWTLFLCILLTFWSLSILVTKWRGVVRRARCISNSPVPESGSLATEESAHELIAGFWDVAKRYKDNLIAARVEKLVQEFQISRDAAAVAATSSTESEAAQKDLELGYAPVRAFSWTIPVLGFIGTVLGIGQAAGGFASFLLTSAQQPDEVRRAVATATSNLAFALDTTLVAVLLTVIVIVFYVLLQHKEKALLRAADEFCRSRLLPLMRPESPLPADKLPEFDTTYLEQNKEIIQECARSLNETGTLLIGQREILDKILETMRESQERSTAFSAGRPESPASADRITEDAYRSWEHPAAGAAGAATRSMPANMDDIWIPLEDLRETIREVNPILRRLAEHLRQNADEAKQPHALKLNFAGRASTAAAGE